MKISNSEVGIIVGRFQVPNLHKAHINMIQEVISNHKTVFIILGISPHNTSLNNPLPFETRRVMIEETFPTVRCIPLPDTESDEVWVANLNILIHNLVATDSVTLYGGRDSFLNTYKKYSGKYKTIELIPDEYVKSFSGTEVREKVAKKLFSSEDFRNGIIWANYNRYPTVYTTVDAVIMNKDWSKVLLCKKNHHDLKWRFIGGFSDPNGESFEDDLIREVAEETNLGLTFYEYISNNNIDDWRYKGEKDQIRTILYIVQTQDDPTPGDDIVSVKWFPIEQLLDDKKRDLILMPNHNALFSKNIKKIINILERKTK